MSQGRPFSKPASK